MRAPQVVVSPLLLARHAEAGHLHARRVEPGHDAADHPVLAAGVDRLENKEHRACAFGEEALLQLGDGGDLLGELWLGHFLDPAERLAWVVVVEIQLRPDPEVIQERHDRTVSPRHVSIWQRRLPIGAHLVDNVGRAP